MFQFLCFVVVLMSLFSMSGCEKKAQEYHYQEIVIEPAMPNAPFMGEDPHAGLGLDIPMMKKSMSQDSSLAWEVPTGWEEVPGSGMRVASFKLVGHPDEIDVSIVSLGGMAGGVESNLNRWANQINLDVDAQELAKFIEDAATVKTQSGVDARIFDFTKLQKGQDPSGKSMAAAMMDLGGATVFVKMTGTTEAVTNNQEAFKTLTQSVHNK